MRRCPRNISPRSHTESTDRPRTHTHSHTSRGENESDRSRCTYGGCFSPCTIRWARACTDRVARPRQMARLPRRTQCSSYHRRTDSRQRTPNTLGSGQQAVDTEHTGQWTAGSGHQTHWAVDSWQRTLNTLGSGQQAADTEHTGQWTTGSGHRTHWAVDSRQWAPNILGSGQQAVDTEHTGQWTAGSGH